MHDTQSLPRPPQTNTFPAERQESMVTSPKRLARIAGVLYLLVAIFRPLPISWTRRCTSPATRRPRPGTYRALRAGPGRRRRRLGPGDGLGFPGNDPLPAAQAREQERGQRDGSLHRHGAGITLLNAVFEFEGLRAATGAVNLAPLGPAGSHAQVLLLLDTQHYGFLIAQIFFGLWLVPLGYLACTSGMFPKALGVLLVVGGACYLAGTLAAFLIPGSGQTINTVLTIPSAIAEICMVIYLIVIGVRTPHASRASHCDGVNAAAPARTWPPGWQHPDREPRPRQPANPRAGPQRLP